MCVQVQVLEGQVLLEHCVYKHGHLDEEESFHELEKSREHKDVLDDDRRDEQPDWADGGAWAQEGRADQESSW